MSQSQPLFDGEPAPALILLYPGERGGLWDREVSALVDELEERLDGVFVTHVARRGGPTLGDAWAAARYAGCEWAVLASPPGATRPGLADGHRPLPAVSVAPRWEGAAIAAAYELARSGGLEIAA